MRRAATFAKLTSKFTKQQPKFARNYASKIVNSAEEAVKEVGDGATLYVIHLHTNYNGLGLRTMSALAHTLANHCAILFCLQNLRLTQFLRMCQSCWWFWPLRYPTKVD